MEPLPEYIDIPIGATPIPTPRELSGPAPVNSDVRVNGVNGASQVNGSIPSPSSSFPSSHSSSTPQKKSSLGSTISSNVSDLVLSTILPPNLPTLPAPPHVHGKARELTSQKSGLGLNVMTANFRRFVTKVGPVFWFQDRVEEIMFWHKPMWTWAFMATWTFICFYPRAVLFFPTAILLIIYLNFQERKNPIPSLLGVTTAPADIGTHRVGNSASTSFSASTAPDAEGTPVVPPKEAESSVDYFMNMQAIQNLMGLIADGFDLLAPAFSYLAGESATPTSFPLAPAHIVLALLPPSIALPLVPTWVLPFALLPVGLVPPLLFHPNLVTLWSKIPHARALRVARHHLEDAVLTDCLTDDVGSKRIARVQVVENERLDPALAAKNSSNTSNGWSSRFLRTGERLPWVKIRESSLWARDDLVPGTEDDGKMVLALEGGWKFVPNEDWRVDVSALWSESEPDADGWVYTDDSWANPGPQVVDDPTVLPVVSKRTTRQRRWWRRVYFDPAAVADKAPAPAVDAMAKVY